MRTSPRRAGRRGSNATEFALTLPIIVALLTGIVDYGYYFSCHQSVIAATRDACRYGATGTETDDREAMAIERAEEGLTNSGFDPADATITITFTGDAPDETITVDVALPYEELIGIVPKPSTLHSQLTMRLEDQAGEG